MRSLVVWLVGSGCVSRLSPDGGDPGAMREGDPPLLGTYAAADVATLTLQESQLWTSAMGDLTGDGVADLVVGNPKVGAPPWGGFGGGLLTVWDGATLQAVATRYGAHPYDAVGTKVWVAELDDDGIDDLIVTTGYGTYVTYGPITGDAAIDQCDAALSWADGGDVAAADLTGDGRTDLAISVARLGETYVFDGAPVGGVAQSAAARVYAGGGAVLAGDLTGDGHPDLVRGLADRVVEVAHGPLVDGGPTTWRTFSGAYDDQLALAIAPDLTDDGVDDLVAGCEQYGADNTGRVLVWDGATERTITGHLPQQRLGYAVAGAGDVDGDGYNDLAVGSFGPQTVTLIYGPVWSGQSTAGLLDLSATFTGAYTVRAGRDFTGDHVPDLFLGNRLTNTVYAVPGAARATTGPMPVEALAVGDLVVTEIMANPSGCADTAAEWFEVYVAADLSVDLDGLAVRDEANTVGVVTGSWVVEPGQYVVLGTPSASAWCPTAFTPDGFYGASPKWNNSGDTVELVTPSGRVVDAAHYTTRLAASGVSAALVDPTPDAVTNDDLGAWVGSTTPLGAEFGTPGQANP